MNVSAPVHMHARLRPRALAVITPTHVLNFAQFDAAIWRAAVNFKGQGLEARQVVVVDMGDSVRHLIVALALARIGVAHLAKPPRQDASVTAPLAARVNAVRTIADADAGDDVLFGKAEVKREGIRAIANAMTQFGHAPWIYATSSGTTGRTKIIPITHRMTLEKVRRHAAGIPTLASDRYLPLSELAFDSPKRRVVSTLNVGGCVVFADGVSVDQWLEFTRRARVTRVSCAAVHLHRLCAMRCEGMLLPNLRALEVAGSTVTEKLRNRVRQKVSRNLYVSYGAIESGTVTVAPPEVEIPDTVGAALPAVHLEVVDEADKPLPFNEVGLVRIRAPGTVEGYLDDAEATAKAFRNGWFYPGDLGALTEDDQLIYKGRADDMMLYDGINIYPSEIETALAAHEAVVEVAAFGVKSEIHQDVPIAAVTLGTPTSEDDLLAFCRLRLGQRAPQRILVIEVFPRNPAGKILKRELADLLGRKLAAERETGKPKVPTA